MKKDNYAPKKYVQPASVEIYFLRTGFKVCFYLVCRGVRGLSLPNQESVFFFNSGAGDHTLNKQKT